MCPVFGMFLDWFTGRWSGVELWVMCPVCGMFLDWFTGRWSGVELWVMCLVCGMFLDWFTGRWSGVELWVTCLVCGMFLDWLCPMDKTEPVKKLPANRTHNPQLHTRPTTCKPSTIGSNHLYKS